MLEIGEWIESEIILAKNEKVQSNNKMMNSVVDSTKIKALFWQFFQTKSSISQYFSASENAFCGLFT